MAQTALITGASSGIGYAFAQLLAAKNYDLVLISRDARKLSEIKQTFEKKYHIKVHIIPKDLSLATSPLDICHELEKNQIAVDLLINNAGCGVGGPFLQTDWNKEAGMIQLNIVNLLYLTKLILPHMTRRNNGGIINVASTVAFTPGPLMSVYYATKAFVLSFSQALAYELKDSGVHVTTLCPGPTLTDFQQKTGIKIPQYPPWAASAQDVALFGYKAWLHKKPVAIYGLINKILVILTRCLPGNWIMRATDQFQKSKY